MCVTNHWIRGTNLPRLAKRNSVKTWWRISVWLFHWVIIISYPLHLCSHIYSLRVKHKIYIDIQYIYYMINHYNTNIIWPASVAGHMHSTPVWIHRGDSTPTEVPTAVEPSIISKFSPEAIVMICSHLIHGKKEKPRGDKKKKNTKNKKKKKTTNYSQNTTLNKRNV